MAKKKPDTKEFLTALATDPVKLGKFILDPDGELKAAKIPSKDHANVKAGVMHLAHDKLIKPPEAFHILHG